MRNVFRPLAGALAFSGLLLAGQARPASGAVEKSLLGVRILSSYKDVLKRYGAPTRVYRAGETINFVDATNALGQPTGGVKGVGDASSNAAGGGGGPMGPMGGPPPGMGGPPPGMGGSPYGGGRSPYGGPMGPGGAGSGGPGGGGSGGSGAPYGGGRMPGGPMGPGGAGSGGGSLPGAQGGMAGAGGQQEQTFAQSGGYSWVYLFPTKELAYQFIFNPDNRLIGIYQRGKSFGGKTSKGVGLGSPVRGAYALYGWPDSTVKQVNMTSLLYNVKSHTQFDTLNNKVVGIAVFLREDMKIIYVGGGGGGAGGGAPGAPGVPGGRGKGGGGGPGSPVEI